MSARSAQSAQADLADVGRGLPDRTALIGPNTAFAGSNDPGRAGKGLLLIAAAGVVETTISEILT